MPFKSQKQRAWMYENKPEMAKEWEKETPKGIHLPKYVKDSKHKPENMLKSAMKKIG